MKMAYEALMKTVAAEYPELHYEKLQYVFPAFVVQFLQGTYFDLLQMDRGGLEQPAAVGAEEGGLDICTFGVVNVERAQ
jgi:hypothetical protein